MIDNIIKFLIEVKIGEFNPAVFGQLVFYVNAIDDLEKTNVDNETPYL